MEESKEKGDVWVQNVTFTITLSHTGEKKSRDSEGERLLRSSIDPFQALVKFLKENGLSYVQMHARNASSK